MFSQMWMSAWKKNYSYHISEIFDQSCLCVTFNLWPNPSFGMLLSKLSNRNTHVCTSSIRMISFFYPSVCLPLQLFTSCNVSTNASLVSARTGGGGGGQPNVDRAVQGKGSPKNSQICADIRYG